jgi:hypothetical protein
MRVKTDPLTIERDFLYECIKEIKEVRKRGSIKERTTEI